MRKLLAFVLFLWSASTALAGQGSVTIENRAEHTIEANSFDWDDVVRSDAADIAELEPGQTGTVTCRKSWFEADSLGCVIAIRDRATRNLVWNWEKKDSGTYVFSGTWSYKPCVPTLTCVDNVQVSLEKMPPTVEPPAGAVSLSKTFDMPKPAASSSILETGNFRLDWQDDGNLVVYKDGSTPVWASKTNGTGAGFYFGSGGDLKIYGRGGFNDNKWTVPTYQDQDPQGLGGDRLFLFPDGNLLVLNSNNVVLWQTGVPQ